MIKKIIFTILLLTTTVVALEVNWAKEFKTGIKQATKENKPALFIFSNHNCRYCVMLDNTTLSDKKVIKALNKDFISIISYTDEGDYTPRNLVSRGTPAIWFLMPDGEPMYAPIPGAIGAEQFLEALAIVKIEFDRRKNIK